MDEAAQVDAALVRLEGCGCFCIVQVEPHVAADDLADRIERKVPDGQSRPGVDSTAFAERPTLLDVTAPDIESNRPVRLLPDLCAEQTIAQKRCIIPFVFN